MGITIRTQRTDAPSRSRTYTLIDRNSGTMLYADVQGLEELQTRLWWIARDRRFALASRLPDDEASVESCPSCGAPRIGLFRWCRSCGLDYEAIFHPEPDWARTRGPETDVTVAPGAPAAPLPQRRASARASRRTRLADLRYAVANAFRFGSLRELGVGAIVGILLGVIVSILLSGVR